MSSLSTTSLCLLHFKDPFGLHISVSRLYLIPVFFPFFLASVFSYLLPCLLTSFTVLSSINFSFCFLVSVFRTVASESTVMAASLRMTPNSNSTRSSQPNIKIAGSRTSNNLNSTSALDSKKKVQLKKCFCHWLSCNLRE